MLSRFDDIVQNLQSHNWLAEQKEDNFREKLSAERRNQWPFKVYTLKKSSEFHNSNAPNNYHSSNYYETFTLSFIMRDRRIGDFEGKKISRFVFVTKKSFCNSVDSLGCFCELWS